MKKLTPSPKFEKKTNMKPNKKKPPSLLLTCKESLDFIKSTDTDFKANPKIKNRTQRGVDRLVKKENREKNWKKSNPKWKVLLTDRFYP